MVFPEDEEELQDDVTEVAESVEFFYLWDIKLEVFNVYKIARLYTDSESNLNPMLLLELIKKTELDSIEALVDVALIHSGYLQEFYKNLKKKEDA